MVLVDWKVCAATVGIIVLLTILLIRLHPAIHRIELAVEGLSPPPPKKLAPKEFVGEASPQRSKSKQKPRDVSDHSVSMAPDPPRGDTDGVTQKAGLEDDGGFDL